MSIGSGLRSHLLGDAGISSVVGAGRIYPITLPQAPTLPAVTYFEVSAQRPHATPQGPLGVAGSRFQVDAWALTYLAAYDLAEKIRKRIDGFRGAVAYGTDSPQSSVTVQGVFSETARDLYEPEPKQFRISRDYTIWFSEPID